MFLITQRTKIELLAKDDLEVVRLLHNEKSILSQLSDSTYVTPKMQLDWYGKLLTSSKSYRYVCKKLSEGEEDLIGVFRVDCFDLANKSAQIGLDIAPTHRRMGYAFEIYTAFINYFFVNQKLHRLYLCTLETNLAAQSLYRKLNFQLEGTQKDAIYRDGKFHNLLNYSLIAE